MQTAKKAPLDVATAAKQERESKDPPGEQKPTRTLEAGANQRSFDKPE